MEERNIVQVELKDELPELLELDELRRTATKLRNEGIAGLLHCRAVENHQALDRTDPHPAGAILYKRIVTKAKVLDIGTPKSCDWPSAGSTNTKATSGHPFGPITGDGPQQPDEVHWKNWVDDKLAVFTAAYHLRARADHPTEALDPEFIFCLYAVLRELYSIGEPDWTFGGARAGLHASGASTFVTMEGARAIGNLQSRSMATAELLRILAKHAIYIQEVHASRASGKYPILPLADSWCDAEIERVAKGIQSLCYEYDGRTMFDLGEWLTELRTLDRVKTTAEVGPIMTTFLQRRETFVEKYVTLTHWRLAVHLQSIRNWRDKEKEELEKNKTLINTAAPGRADTAHALFIGRIEATLKFIQKNFIVLVPGENGAGPQTEEPTPARLSESVFIRAADVFERTGSRVKELLVPVNQFMTNRLNTILLRSQEEGEVSHAQELAFAACCSSMLEMDEHRPSFQKAKELLERAIDQEGVIPPGPAFYENADDTVRIPNNAHTLGAMAQLMAMPSYRPRLQTVRRMVQYFEAGLVDPVAFDAENKGVSSESGKKIWSRNRHAGLGDPGTEWVTCVNILALDRIVRMLNAQINTRVLAHFSKRMPSSLVGPRTKMDELMCSDIGLASLNWEKVGRERKMLTYDMERLRRWLVPRATGDRDPMSSMIIYGPPGTGKTTIVSGLAASAAVPLVEITPSDLIIRGTEAVEVQTKVVMRALSLLTRVVILFDEFDPVIADRDQQREVKSIFSFLTGAMLPKLADLNKAAKENHFVYVLATNYIDRLDSAAIRPGRFDHKRGVYPPDLASRMCRLISELRKWTSKAGGVYFRDGWQGRACQVIRNTAGVPMERLVSAGWFNPPKEAAPSPPHDIDGIEDPGRILQEAEHPTTAEPFHAFEYIAWGGDWTKYRYPLPMDLRPQNEPYVNIWEDLVWTDEVIATHGLTGAVSKEVLSKKEPSIPSVEEKVIRALAQRNNLVSDQAIELVIVGAQNKSAYNDRRSKEEKWDVPLAQGLADWDELIAISDPGSLAKNYLDHWKQIDVQSRDNRIRYAAILHAPENEGGKLESLLAKQEENWERAYAEQSKRISALELALTSKG